MSGLKFVCIERSAVSVLKVDAIRWRCGTGLIHWFSTEVGDFTGVDHVRMPEIASLLAVSLTIRG